MKSLICGLCRVMVLSFCVVLSSCAQFSNVHDWITPTPKPTPAPQPTPLSDVDFSKVLWLSGQNPCNAPVTVAASNLNLVPGSCAVGLSWSLHLWEPNDGSCDGALGVLWRQKDTVQMYGIYIEWCPMNRLDYEFSNPLLNMYHNPNHKPFAVQGDDCWFFIMARDGHERSNAVQGIWPINDDGKE